MANRRVQYVAKASVFLLVVTPAGALAADAFVSQVAPQSVSLGLDANIMLLSSDSDLNVAEVVQSGTANVLSVYQTGVGNLVRFVQSGNGNIGLINQRGINTSSIVQR